MPRPLRLWAFSLRNGFLRRLGLWGILCATACGILAVDLVILSDREAAEELFDVFFAAELIEGEAVLDDLQRLDLARAELQHPDGTVDQAATIRQIALIRATIRTRLDALRWRTEAESDLRPLRYVVMHLQEALDLAATVDSGFDPDGHDFGRAFHSHTLEARTGLNRYRDTLRWQQDLILRQQIAEAQSNRYWLAALVSLVMVLGMVSLLILRRELRVADGRRQAEKRAEFLAYFDPLTELANRTRFNEDLALRLDGDGPLSLIYLDLDGFKAINDTHGHAAGDLVLAIFAARMNLRLNPLGGICARLGGDEFAAILPVPADDTLRACLSQLLADALVPVDFEGVPITVGTSIGVVSLSDIDPGTSDRTEALLAAADFALYAAKEAGRGVIRFYDQTLASEQAERRMILSAIPGALETDGFVAAYQPKVDLRSQTVLGFEALIRWNRDGKLVAPGVFLPIAEQSGLILELDRHMLRLATRQLAEWNTAWSTNLSVSVNLSTGHFRSPQIVRDVEEALEASGLEPWLLTLEITETVLIEDWKDVEDTLASLKALGVLISLDDFGTGFSSLAYLRRIAADELKIDRDFITDIEHSEETRFILDSIVDMAHTMHMVTLVEGVETEAQAKLVNDFGCRLGQGFYWSKPLMPAEVERKILPGLVPEGPTQAKGSEA